MSLISKGDIDQIINIRVLRLASKMSLIFQRETLRPAGITAQQWRLLISLAQFGELHLRSMARHSSLDPAHTSRVAKIMVIKGWIANRPDADDQRRTLYSLTDSGATLVEKFWPDAKLFAADIAELFDKDEFEQLRAMLDKANALCDARLK